MLTGIVRWIFGDRLRDMLSGYRVFSRRFVKSFPALAAGFETETEFTIHALELKMPVAEVPIAYKERAEGLALQAAHLLGRHPHPAHDRGAGEGGAAIAVLRASRRWCCSCSASVSAFRSCSSFSSTGLVPRLPTAVLATGLVLLSFLALVCGLVLDSVARGRKEIKRLAYLAIPAVGANG